MALYEIQPFTMLDFPGEMACIAWFSGCNLRCVYCHNPEIVLNKGKKEDAELFSFLETRKGRLTGVVFSGGEPTYVAALPEIMRRVREMGFKVKLDTNGSNPDVVAALLGDGLLDYVALDYKTTPEKAVALIGTDAFIAPFRQTLQTLIAAAKNGLGFEVRTTFHADLMDEDDLNTIMDDLSALGFAGTYFIQNIGSVGEKTLGNIEKPTREIDKSLLRTPSGFKVAFRNFKDEKKEI